MKLNHKGKKAQKALVMLVVAAAIVSLPIVAFATGVTPVDNMMNNTTDFLTGIARGIGGLVVVWGIVQIAMSVSSHDSTQRMTGFLLLIGGGIAIFAKEILTFIQGS